ncbi:MAG TPA: hypothetical protein VFS43_29135 [Polyangiaceae bacterium]|nr:hypothetical protein [Polyangiaceae bacterium]
MRRHLSLLLALPLAASFYVAGCLSDSDGAGASGAGGASGTGTGGSTSTGGTGTGGSGTGGSTVAGSGGGTTAGSAGSGGAPGPDPSTVEASKDADRKYVPYRDNLAEHPGCTKADLDTRKAFDGANASYTATESIQGYPCAAKEYALPVAEDTTKPIVVLVHGNSSTPLDFEAFPAGTGAPQLSEQLVQNGFKTFAVDFRFDKNPDPQETNPGRNIDHGWAVPILQSMTTALFQQYPDRKFSLVGFSLGTTVIRDTLRRMHREKKVPFSRIKDLVLLAGGNHGVSTFFGQQQLCVDVNNPKNPTMAGLAACQLGDRGSYVPVPFHVPLNGPDGAFETPCLDGVNAFGQAGVCGGNSVQYTTIVMKDEANGVYQDEFVSQGSSALKGATNLTVELEDQDPTTYFLGGFFDDHYGALRSPKALGLILAALGD